MSTDIVKCTQCNIVINELLCFVQNKIDVMDEESLIRLIVGEFSTLEINNAKELLFSSISTTVKNISRRKNREQKETEDIICVLKNTDPDKTPIFVAKELQKLPPVTFDHIDATRLLKDIIVLQSDVKQIKDTYVTNERLNNLKIELNNMKYASLVNCDNVNNKRGAYLLDSGPAGFLNVSRTPAKNSTPEKKDVFQQSVLRSHSQDKINTSPQSQTSDISFVPTNVVNSPHRISQIRESHTQTAGVTTASTGSDSRQAVMFTITKQLTAGTAAHTVANPVSSVCMSENDKSMAGIVKEKWKPEKTPEKWVQVQRKKHRNRIESIRGKAKINPKDRFKPADLKIPLFVSNVHKDTSEEDIMDYILLKTRETVFLQKIKMKTERGYNAYKIMVAKHKLNLFLNDEIWPDATSR
ncbi:uncharacterized protein LOC128201762 [Galleria mellonella]|uniref:Uncharacterized protein LOC128201762 n=1 Tax=Galleria mellonella TaxID=7137 RepID=A0ABM3MW68_GALME|nr:uncharacterized protein LOC128201762 [Galleria mellonella]